VKAALAAVTAHIKRRAEWYWAPLLYCAVVAVLYHDVWSGDIGFGWDTIESYWADLGFLSDQLAIGEFPQWNPYERGGYPFGSDPQTSVYYPVQWLFAGIGSVLGGVGWWLIQLKMLAHHVLAAALMHLFLRSRGLPRTAAIIGGVAWIVSTPWIIHKASNVLLPMAWTPLIWLAIDKVVERPTWRRGTALAGSIYLAGSTGAPPGFFYTLVMATCYGLFRGGDRIVRAIIEDRNEAVKLAGRLALTIMLAAATAGALLWIVVGPGLDLAEASTRAKRTAAWALSAPLPTVETVRALFTPLAGKVDAYAGILVMMLACLALTMRPIRDKGAPIFFACAAALYLLFSFGDATPVLPAMVEHVPGFGLFRISSRYKLLFVVALSALAAYGAAGLLAAPRDWSRQRLTAIGVTVLTAAIALWMLRAYPLPKELVNRFPGPKLHLTITLLAAAMVIASAIHRPRAAVWLLAAMPLIIFTDAHRYWHHKGPIMEKRPNHIEDLEVLRAHEGAGTTYRVYDEWALEQRSGTRLGFREFRGYPSGDPLASRRYQDVLNRARREPHILEAFNIRYVLHGGHRRGGKHTNYIKRPPDQASPQHFQRKVPPVYEALHPAPHIAWYGAVDVSKPDAALSALLATEDTNGQRRAAVVTEDQLPIMGELASVLSSRKSPPPSVPGRVTELTAEQLRATIVAPEPGIVVLNEVDYPGWSVTVDGEPARTFTANWMLRAVVVPAGSHTLEWTFSPVGHGKRLALWLLGLLVLLSSVLPLRTIARRLRPSAKTAEPR
jgi:hypothetical protein